MWPGALGSAQWTMIVAVFGTTISPYLFFWQSSQEAEEMHDNGQKPLRRDTKRRARSELLRIRIDTFVGMAVSNLVGFFIIVAAGATLHAQGITNIETSAQAAEALKPIAGPFASIVFTLGIVGTGLLAVPVLVGSTAYALGEAFKWPIGLASLPHEAKAFYATIAAATALGVVINFTDIDPIKALVWSAVINGVVAVPLMGLMMHMAGERRIMGGLTLSRPLTIVGWLATAVMAAMVGIMAWTAF